MKKEERDEELWKQMHMFDEWVKEGKIPDKKVRMAFHTIWTSPLNTKETSTKAVPFI